MTRRTSKSGLLLAAWAMSAVQAASANAAGVQATAFAIPAMPLGESLRRVARQSARNLIVDDSLVSGRTAAPLTGRLTAEQAIEQLLRGTGLQYRLVGDTLVISKSGFQAAGRSSPAAPDRDEVIVVTGTNVRGAQPTSPVITIGRREIDEIAPGSVEELLRKLPQNLSSGVGQENFGVTGAGADITDHGAGVNLRGLGQRATLTLVNGRRLAPSGSGSFVDISLIPISAVERVEVVTDGASAIYGSDAVGGVVNLILRDDFSGLETIAQAGSATSGDGDQLLLGATGGQRWSGGHALVSYEFRRDDEIQAGDRSYTIGLPDRWSLFPRERRHSVYANAAQELVGGLTLDLSAVYATRDTRRSYFVAGPAVPVAAVAKARTVGGTAALVWDVDSNWRIEGSASYFAARTEQEQNQPDGQGLVNRFDTMNRLVDFNLKGNGSVMYLPGGALKAAVGAQLRREYYASVFETQVNTANPQSASRTVSSLYGEMFIPLVGGDNRMAGIDRLAVTAAARFDRYEGLGTSVDPKLGVLWSPLRGLDFRASYSTSFRAPLLSETLGYYNAFLFPAALLYIDPSTAPEGVGAALVGADPDVKPERSKSWTLGVDWKPVVVPGLSFSATYYAIQFSNRIALPTEQIVVVGDPGLAPIVTLNPGSGPTDSLLDGAGQVLDFSGPGFTDGGATAEDVVVIVDVRSSNSAETVTSGLDLGVRYDFALGDHRFRLDGNANKVFRFDDRLTGTSPVIETVGTPFHPVDWRGRAVLGWAWRQLAGNVAVNHTADYRDDRAGSDRRVGSFTTVDAGLSYQGSGSARGVMGGLRIALNAQNLFDRRPPRLEPEPGFSRGIGYDPVNASGRGRMLSIQVRKTW